MNKQSNTYTIIYIIILVVLTGTALAYTAMSLKPRQQANADADKMKQILASVHVAADAADVAELYGKYITESFVVDAAGKRIDNVDAFDVDVKAQADKAADDRRLPVYVAHLDDGSAKYILPLYGAGLWGPIWGYVAVDADGTTLYGAYFSHAGETPGLGAEIAKPDFQNRFDGKKLFVDGNFKPIEVVKNGLAPAGSPNVVDGVSGGTITSKGVSAMLDNCLTPYKAFLETLTTD